jgi:thiol:disulfide interchange protein
MKSKVVALGAALAVFALAGCDRRKDEPPPPEPKSAAAKAAGEESHLPPGIAWFDGDVDAAFAAAKAANKPVFLYWGAEWCPPCAQIKTTIFAKREFQDRSRLFVPVYLDGDTPSAQKHGERFGVVG